MMPFKPGVCNYIGLRKTESKRLPDPFSSCTDLKSYKSVLYDQFVKYGKKYRGCAMKCANRRR